MNLKKAILATLIGGLGYSASLSAAVQTRIKDVVTVRGAGDYELAGLGLVIGLAGDGDRNQTYTLQAFANVLQRNGINVSVDEVQSKNIAIVEVQAKVSAFAKSGSRVDVLVSSIGDARSLHGGTLMRTLLFGPSVETAYAVAQGPISVGGFNAGTGGAGGASVRRNHPVVGQILGGGRLIRPVPEPTIVKYADGKPYMELELRHPDYSTSARIAEAINGVFEDVAYSESPSFVRLEVPPALSDRPVDLLARIEPIQFRPDVSARVLINERTGTIVATTPVKISSCAISHGNLTISIASPLNVSQPAPLSPNGQTTVTPSTDVTVTDNGTGLLHLPEMPTIQEVSSSLNSLGVSTRDIIAIFQAMERSGALQAEVIYQ